ncbi:MAG: carbon dioxide concentrating mechanism protein [Microcystaceae cyanobacterium]
MHLPPVQSTSDSDIYMCGDVTIHPSAVVAAGTILQATPNSRIIIGAGACVGMGVILNAYQGVIEVAAGAILGAGVLMIGEGKIGDNACIGAATTILNTSVEAMTVVPAGSLMGDTSRQVATPSDSEIAPEAEQITGEASVQAKAVSTPEVEVAATSAEAESTSNEQKGSVIGRVYINQLLFTLFPEGRSFNS